MSFDYRPEILARRHQGITIGVVSATFAVNSALQFAGDTPLPSEICYCKRDPADIWTRKLHLSLNLLGCFQAFESNLGTPLVFPRKKAAALLALLAMPAGQQRSREDIAEMFWGYTGDTGARNSLRQTLLAIRKILPDFRGLDVTANSLMLLPEYLNIDVSEFELAAGEEGISELARAASLYTGAFLQGFNLREEGFERWRAGEATRLRDIALSVFERLMTEYLATDRQPDAAQIANRTLTIDPLHEAAHQTLIRVYTAQGRNGLARQQYEKCRDLLARELGISPSRETERIFATLLGWKNMAQRPLERGFGAPIILPDFHTAPIVAVLPFDSGAGPTTLAAMLTPKLIAVLAAALPLTIVDHRSVLLATAQNTSTTDLANTFGARYAVEGSIRSWNGRWRTDFSLINVMTGRHLSTGSCENAGADLFQLADALALDIGGNIAYQIVVAERNLASVSDCGPVDAWLSHNRGMALLTSQSLKNVKPAQLAFLHAVEIEPNNAKAISGLALGVLGGGVWHLVESREDAFEESHQLALKAYSLDHADPFVNFVLGQTYHRTERHDLALESLQRALNVTPGNPEICAAMGNLLAFMGIAEQGALIMKKALEFSESHITSLARSYLQIGDYKRSRSLSERAIQNEPDTVWPYIVLASALGHLDLQDEAIAALQAGEETQPGCVNSEFLVRPTQYKDPREQDHILAGVLKAGWQP